MVVFYTYGIFLLQIYGLKTLVRSFLLLQTTRVKHQLGRLLDILLELMEEDDISDDSNLRFVFLTSCTLVWISFLQNLIIQSLGFYIQQLKTPWFNEYITIYLLVTTSVLGSVMALRPRERHPENTQGSILKHSCIWGFCLISEHTPR